MIIKYFSLSLTSNHIIWGGSVLTVENLLTTRTPMLSTVINPSAFKMIMDSMCVTFVEMILKTKQCSNNLGSIYK